MRRVPSGVLRPGESMPTHPAPNQTAFDFWGWLRDAVTYKPLTTRQTRVAKWLGVVVVLLVAIAFAGVVTDGRIGLAGVVGGSMARYFPQGSTVVTLPLPPREGSFVVARAGAPDATEDVEVADVKSQLVVKQYKGGKLVSSDDGNVYSTFEYRGRVWFHLHTEKIFWWRDTGVQRPVPGYKPPTDLDRAVVHASEKVATARDKWLSQNCRLITADKAEVVGGRHNGCGFLAESNEMLVTFDFGQKVRIEEVEVQPPGEFWGFTAEPSIGQQVAGSAGRFRPALECKKLKLIVTGCLSGPANQPADIGSIRVWVR